MLEAVRRSRNVVPEIGDSGSMNAESVVMGGSVTGEAAMHNAGASVTRDVRYPRNRSAVDTLWISEGQGNRTTTAWETTRNR